MSREDVTPAQSQDPKVPWGVSLFKYGSSPLAKTLSTKGTWDWQPSAYQDEELKVFTASLKNLSKFHGTSYQAHQMSISA